MKTDRLPFYVAAMLGVATAALWSWAWRDDLRGEAPRAASPGSEVTAAPSRKLPAASSTISAAASTEWAGALAQPLDFQRSLALWPLLLQMSPAELSELITRGLQERTMERAALSLAARQLAALDPPAALSLLAGLRRASEHDYIVAPIFEVLAEAEPALVPRWLATRPRDGRVLLEGAWAGALARFRPAEAMDWLAAHPEADADVGKICGDLARRSPKLALAKAAALTRPFLRRYAFEGALEVWGEADPAAALAWLRQPEGLARRKRMLGRVFVAAAKKDPALAAELAWQAPERLGNEYLGTILRSWAERDPAAARAWLERLPPEMADRQRAQFAELMARDQPAVALAFAQRGADAEGTSSAVKAVVSAWMKEDPSAAQAWLRSQQPGLVRHAALHAMLESSADPGLPRLREMLDLMRNLSGGLQQSERSVATQVLRRYAALDFDGAFTWAQQEPVGKLRLEMLGSALSGGMSQPARVGDLLLSRAGTADGQTLLEVFRSERLISDWARVDAAAAARWTARMGDPEQQHWLREQLAARWAYEDPAAAQAWAQSVGQPEQRLEYLRAIFRTWADVTDALAAVQRLPADARDALLPVVLNRYAHSNPNATAVLAERLPESPQRAEVFRTVAEQWLEFDPPAARGWIERNRGRFSEEELRRFLGTKP